MYLLRSHIGNTTRIGLSTALGLPPTDIPPTNPTNGTFSSVTNSAGVALFHSNVPTTALNMDDLVNIGQTTKYAAGAFAVNSVPTSSTFTLKDSFDIPLAYIDTDSGTWAKVP